MCQRLPGHVRSVYLALFIRGLTKTIRDQLMAVNLDGKRGAAAASRCCIRVVDHELRALEALDIVDL